MTSGELLLNSAERYAELTAMSAGERLPLSRHNIGQDISYLYA